MKIKNKLASKVLFTAFIVILIASSLFVGVNGGELVSYPASYAEKSSSITKPKSNGKYIIKFKDNIPQEKVNEFKKKNNLSTKKIGKEQIDSNVTISNNEITNLDSNIIESIEPDYIIQTQSISYDDPLYKDQWYLKAIGYEQKSNPTTPESKVIAVIDSGSCANHPDLKDRILPGWNFVGNNSDTSDNFGHGCAVSGVIVANSNNNIGIVGLSENTYILPLKVINDYGVGDYSSLIQAIDYAVSQKVNIINISLGGLSGSKILHDSIKKATDIGIKVVASAGNTGNDEILYPAKFEEVISVGSVDNDYTVSSFSSTSQDIDAWAYGNTILSSDKEGSYKEVNGTSIASAMVSGVLANGINLGTKNIINYRGANLKPVFLNNTVTYTEPISKLSFEVPANLNVEGFENINPTSYIINWQKVIKVANGETMAVSIWNRKNKSEINSVYKEILEMDGCIKQKVTASCFVNFPSKAQGQSSGFAKYYTINNTLVRIIYSFNNMVGFNIFKGIFTDIELNSKKLAKQKDLIELESYKTNEQIYAQGDNFCGGISDTNNPYFCCSSQNVGENDANCTWYAAYKRPDLKGTINQWPGGLFNQAKQAGFPTSPNQPSNGALIVWELHVGYVESFDNSNTRVTWSEQNCYSTNNAYNAAVTKYSYTPNYSAGTFLGYILFKDNCSGNNPTLADWNVSSGKSCSPIGTLTILPSSFLNGINGDITIIPR